jgi:hypothetical protein
LPAVRKVARDSASQDYRWSAIILGIVRSTPFTMSSAGADNGLRLAQEGDTTKHDRL